MTGALIERIRPHAKAFGREEVDLLVKVIVLVAYADLEIDEIEMGVLQGAIEAALGSRIPQSEVDDLVLDVLKNIRAAGGLLYAKQMGKNARARGKERQALQLAVAAALSSQGTSASERSRLEAFVDGAGLPETVLDEIEASLTS